MLLIGETRRDAIDWIQERLDYARRDVAEETLTVLLEDGLARIGDAGVTLLEELPEDELRQKSRNAIQNRDQRQTRLFRRRSISTQRNRQGIHQASVASMNDYVTCVDLAGSDGSNEMDCVGDDPVAEENSRRPDNVFTP